MDGAPILVAKCRFFSVFRASSFVRESSCHSTFRNVRYRGRTRLRSRSYTYDRSIHHIYTHARARVCAHTHTHKLTHTHTHTPHLQWWRQATGGPGAVLFRAPLLCTCAPCCKSQLSLFRTFLCQSTLRALQLMTGRVPQSGSVLCGLCVRECVCVCVCLCVCMCVCACVRVYFN